MMPFPAFNTSLTSSASTPWAMARRTRTSASAGGSAYSGRIWTTETRKAVGEYKAVPPCDAAHSRSRVVA